MPAETISNKALLRLLALHRRLGSSEGERATAWEKIQEWLCRHGKNWNDVPELLQEAQRLEEERDREARRGGAPASDDDERHNPSGSAAMQAAATGNGVTSLDLIRHMIERYVALEPHEAIVATPLGRAYVCVSAIHAYPATAAALARARMRQDHATENPGPLGLAPEQN